MALNHPGQFVKTPSLVMLTQHNSMPQAHNLSISLGLLLYLLKKEASRNESETIESQVAFEFLPVNCTFMELQLASHHKVMGT